MPVHARHRSLNFFPAPSRAVLLGATAIALVLAGCSAQNDLSGSAEGEKAGAAETVLRIAERTRAGGDPRAAVGLYRRANAIDGLDTRPLVGMGVALNQVGAAGEAAEAFRRALDLDPDNPEALRGLGNALIALDRPEAAIPHFRAAIEAAPDPRAYGGLGVALDSLGDHGAAQAAYREGLALAPDNLMLRNNLGLSQALAGDYEGAVETLRTVAADPDATARHRQNLALALGLGGRADAAARVARIDLDERAVQANLAHYAQLRGLETGARTAALAFKPAAGIDGRPLALACTGPACATMALALAPEGQPAPTAIAGPLPDVQNETLALASAPGESEWASDALELAPAAGRSDETVVQIAAVTPADPVPASQPVEKVLEEFEPVANAIEAPRGKAPPAGPLGFDRPASGTTGPGPAEQPATRPERLWVAAERIGLGGPVASTLVAAPGGDVELGTAPAEPRDGETALRAAPAEPRDRQDSWHSRGGWAVDAVVEQGSSASEPTDLAPAAGDADSSEARAAFGPVWVQLAAFRSSDRARMGWDLLSDSHRDALAGLEPTVERADLGAPLGVFYRLRIGPMADARDARALCGKLAARQADCMVFEN